MQLARTALKERIEHLNRLILCSKSSGVNSARSSMIGPPAGHMSSMSVRSSIPPNQVVRFSTASSNPSSHGDEHDEDSTGGEFNDGNATLAAQVRALHADLTDRNRYIATLEKRLLHARRSSQNRTSFGPGPDSPRFFGPAVVPEGRVEVLLKEKDDEIAELRARLDDKERMVSALRNAARKRDIAEECGKRYSGESLRSPIESLRSPIESLRSPIAMHHPKTIPEEPPMTEGRDGLLDCF
jgi:centromeric protein E